MAQTLMETIGERIKKARTESGISQAELASRCSWEGRQKRISNYESGNRDPNYSDLQTIANALGVDPAILAFGCRDSTVPQPVEIEPRTVQAHPGDHDTQSLVAGIKTDIRRGTVIMAVLIALHTAIILLVLTAII